MFCHKGEILEGGVARVLLSHQLAGPLCLVVAFNLLQLIPASAHKKVMKQTSFPECVEDLQPVWLLPLQLLHGWTLGSKLSVQSNAWLALLCLND